MRINLVLHLETTEKQAAELQGILRFATQSSRPARCEFIEPLKSLLNQIDITGVSEESNVIIDCGNADSSNN